MGIGPEPKQLASTLTIKPDKDIQLDQNKNMKVCEILGFLICLSGEEGREKISCRDFPEVITAAGGIPCCLESLWAITMRSDCHWHLEGTVRYSTKCSTIQRASLPAKDCPASNAGAGAEKTQCRIAVKILAVAKGSGLWAMFPIAHQ